MWQLDELQRFLDRHGKDAALNSRAVVLINPDQAEELTKIISDGIWPGVAKAVSESPFTTRIGVNQTPAEGVSGKSHEYTARELVYLIEDVERPLGPYGGPPWYCRGRIECTAFDYMVSYDFIISFPDDFSITKIMKILKEPRLQGCPPELTFNESTPGNSEFCVSLTHGKGAGWGLRSTEDAMRHAYEETRRNIELIYAVEQLESDFKSTRYFNELHRAIVNAYEAY